MPVFNFLVFARKIGRTSSEILRGLMAEERLMIGGLPFFLLNQTLMAAIRQGIVAKTPLRVGLGVDGVVADSPVPLRLEWHDAKFLSNLFLFSFLFSLYISLLKRPLLPSYILQ